MSDFRILPSGLYQTSYTTKGWLHVANDRQWWDIPIPVAPTTHDGHPLPLGVYDANRYDTDNERVLHLWAGGLSYDLRTPKGAKP